MTEHRIPIPARVYNAAVDGHVCGPDDIDFGQKVVHLIKYDRAGNEVSFESQVTQANKIYVVHNDFVLSSNVTIPVNCVLKFDGGNISGAYTITGNNTGIDAGLIKIFNTNITLDGSWNVAEAYPEWFGAKGDGVTNDSDAIKSVCKLKNVTIKFSDKTYIVEIETGTSPDDRRILCSCYANSIIGEGNATIKLSDNDNCNKAANRGFNTLFYFPGLTYIVTIKGLNFDYNYKHNIIHHAHSNNEEGYLQNIICSVAAFDECAGFIMRDCNVIDFSGGGVIQSFLSDRRFTDNNGIMYAEVSNCKFSDVGKPSIYNGELAVHDCSIIGVHLDDRREHQKLNRHLKVVIKDNVFEGVGGNAFNTAELCGDEIYFENNYIEGFCYGLLPLASTGDSYCCIKNNVLNKVKKAVGLWNIYMNTTKEFDDVGFKTMDISNNQILFDLLYEFQTPRFNTINNKSTITIDDVEKTIYTEGSNLEFGVLFTSVLPNRGCGDIIVFNNNIKTINYDDIPYSLFNHLNAVISFSLPNNNPEYATIDSVLIDSNNIEFQGKLFRNICYREIKDFQITNNSIKCDLNINPAFKNTGIIWGNVKSDYEGDYSSGISNVLIKDNLIYGSYIAVISNSAFKGTKNGNIVMRNNKAESRILALVPSDYNSYDVDVFSSKEIQNSEMTATLGSVVKIGDSYYNTTIKRPVWWNGTKWVDERGVTANYATSVKRPTLTRDDAGAIFYDSQILKLITWNGERWDLSDVLSGTTTKRNDLSLGVSDGGFLFWDINLLKLCVWNGSGWIEADGSKLDIPRSGTFADKPTVNLHNPRVGFEYFCTDRQTTEGTTDGIIIYHKGNNVWIDALGRVVS